MLTALKDQIICEPMYPPDMKGSLYLPETSRTRCNQGYVKYVGPDVITVKQGDHVIFTGYAGTLIQLEGEGTVLIMPERYVAAIIHEDVFEVSGLYFKTSDGEYIPANYEHAMKLIADASSETDWFRRVSIWEKKPTVAELYARDE